MSPYKNQAHVERVRCKGAPAVKLSIRYASASLAYVTLTPSEALALAAHIESMARGAEKGRRDDEGGEL